MAEVAIDDINIYAPSGVSGGEGRQLGIFGRLLGSTPVRARRPGRDAASCPCPWTAPTVVAFAVKRALALLVADFSDQAITLAGLPVKTPKRRAGEEREATALSVVTKLA